MKKKEKGFDVLYVILISYLPQKSLEFEDLGPKRIAALEKEAEDWRIKGEEAVASIQDITVTYFAQTSKALAGRVYVSYSV